MIDHIIRLFLHSKHPVYAILGEIDYILPQVVQILSDTTISDDSIQYFNFPKDPVNKFLNFVNLYSAEDKIAVCSIGSIDKNNTTVLLKKLEDVSKYTKILLIGPSFPDALKSRSLLFYAYKQAESNEEIAKIIENMTNLEDLKKILEYENAPESILGWFEYKMLKNLQQNNLSVILVEYKMWQNFKEIDIWMKTEQITKQQATKMMISILALGQFSGHV